MSLRWFSSRSLKADGIVTDDDGLREDKGCKAGWNNKRRVCDDFERVKEEYHEQL